ncbi:putative nucleoredoxin 1-2 [Apium graveolens]|uniref:putative nucleoredoxin 1-2 n=1 Tax=Apium graveolens TaxID=4045 RepID=UPI003D78BBD2
MVLQTDVCDLFEKYGGVGYHFSDKRIDHLQFIDIATAKKPSLKALLGSPKRDYVISNKGDKVLIDTLVEKVVAVYFYEEGITPEWLTTDIKKVYEEFAQNKSCFEVVLVYLNDRNATVDRTGEESFRYTFETMPWLAVPFKDPECERLTRFFGYRNDQLGLEESPRLVIFGPHGKYIEPWGSDIILKFKLPAYPFTRERVAKLYTEKLRELNLEMLWDRHTIFRRRDESEVRFSQLVGKRIILFFEGDEENQIRRKKVANFLSMLRKRYFDMKGTSDEFEVIYIITSGKKESSYDMIIAAPWLVSIASELLPIDLSVHCCYCHLLSAPSRSSCSCDKHGKWRRESSMLAFDQNGTVVRKSLELSFKATKFPFYVGSMEKEAFFELNEFFGWAKMDKNHWGLRINSYQKNLKLPYVYSYGGFLVANINWGKYFRGRRFKKLAIRASSIEVANKVVKP